MKNKRTALLIALFIGLSSCSFFDSNTSSISSQGSYTSTGETSTSNTSVGSGTSSSASSTLNKEEVKLLSVKDAIIDEDKKEVFMVVDQDTREVSLEYIVQCSSNAIWKLSYDKLGQSEIPDRTAVNEDGNLKNGDNIFYIVVTSFDENSVEIYTLTIFKASQYNEFGNCLYLGNEENPYFKLVKAKDTSITEATIANNTKFIEYYAFRDCSSLTSIIIPSSVIDIGDRAFYNCMCLTIYCETTSEWSRNWNPEGRPVYWGIAKEDIIKINNLEYLIIDGEAAVTRCDKNASEVIVPKTIEIKGVTYSVTKIGYYAFEGCSLLTSVSFEEESKLKTIGNFAFSKCSSLKSIIIPNSVTKINYRAFKKCSSLTSIVIPNSVISIGDGAFDECTSLASIEIPESVTTIGNFAFQNCRSLTTVSFNEKIKLTNIGDYLFSDCSSLTSISIPSSVTSISAGAFTNCSLLKTIMIPYGVKSIGNGAFTNCSSLTSIIIPNSVTKLGNYVFSKCSSLESIELSNSITKIGDSEFADCTSLKSIVIPDSVTSIGNYAFSDCNMLNSIEIPTSVTSIGSYTFSKCSSLESIFIPSSVISIGEYSFYECSSLTIYCEASSQPSGWNSNWNYSNRPVTWGWKK